MSNRVMSTYSSNKTSESENSGKIMGDHSSTNCDRWYAMYVHNFGYNEPRWSKELLRSQYSSQYCY